MNETTWLVAFGIWIVCGIGAYLITAQKGRDDAGSAGFMGFLLGPVGLVMAAMAKPPAVGRTGRVCVHCGKTVAADRERPCNHCGEPFAALATDGTPPRTSARRMDCGRRRGVAQADRGR